jgi:hypothetical protein
MLALRTHHPADSVIVTYERLHAAPAEVAGELFRFLGVSDDAREVADCVARTSFTALTGGRQPGDVQADTFLRQGMVGGWRATLSEEVNALILRELGWSFQYFGWTA